MRRVSDESPRLIGLVASEDICDPLLSHDGRVLEGGHWLIEQGHDGRCISLGMPRRESNEGLPTE